MNRPSGSDDGWSTPSYGGGGAADTRVGGSRGEDRGAPRQAPPPARQAPQRPGSPRQATSRQATSRQAPPRQNAQLQGPPPVRQQQPAGRRPPAQDDWSAAGPTSAREQRATRLAERRQELDARRTERSVQRLDRQAQPRPYERGYPWWAALIVLIAVTLLGALVDSLTSSDNQNGFNIAIVVASVIAILMVKRSQMFPIVVSPPIVYSLAALLQLYLRSSLSQDNKGAIDTILNAVQNYLVYGFPALATATAAVLIIAGIRLVARK